MNTFTVSPDLVLNGRSESKYQRALAGEDFKLRTRNIRRGD